MYLLGIGFKFDLVFSTIYLYSAFITRSKFTRLLKTLYDRCVKIKIIMKYTFYLQSLQPENSVLYFWNFIKRIKFFMDCDWLLT